MSVLLPPIFDFQFTFFYVNRVVDLRDPKLAVSVRALLDQFLYSNLVYVLKALLRRGSELLRVTIGKVQWALRVQLVRDARQCAACLCQPYPYP